MWHTNSENSPPERIRWSQFSNLLEIFIFSNSHDKNIYPQQLFIISELSGGEAQEQYYQYKIRKHLERDSKSWCDSTYMDVWRRWRRHNSYQQHPFSVQRAWQRTWFPSKWAPDPVDAILPKCCWIMAESKQKEYLHVIHTPQSSYPVEYVGSYLMVTRQSWFREA